MGSILSEQREIREANKRAARDPAPPDPLFAQREIRDAHAAAAEAARRQKYAGQVQVIKQEGYPTTGPGGLNYGYGGYTGGGQPVGEGGGTFSADDTPGKIAGQRSVYRVDGQLFLVWLVPVDLDGDGNFTESIPIAYAADPQELVDAGLFASTGAIQIDEELTAAEWQQLGGLNVGDIVDLNNTDDDPFEFYVDQMVENSILFPWILDPEIMAKTGAAWLEGRELSEAELVGTEWWQSHTDSERAWMIQASQDPIGAENLTRDNRLMVLDMLETAGVNNATGELVNLMADSFTRGEWSQVYLSNQVGLVSDPAKRGDIDGAVEAYLSGASADGFILDTTTGRREEVRQLVDSWLGPVYGQWDGSQVDEWAGRIRNDPDAATALQELLSGQRLAMFGEYEDPTLRYDDIAGPWRGFVQQIWGETADETDPLFSEVVRLNNSAEAGTLLRREGIARGNKKVTDEMTGNIIGALGGQVARVR